MIEGKPLYIVEKHGVYCQGIAGVFDSESDALKAAARSLQVEIDDYHNFHVLEFRANTFYNLTDHAGPEPDMTLLHVFWKWGGAPRWGPNWVDGPCPGLEVPGFMLPKEAGDEG